MCAKGFFIVYFKAPTNHKKVIENGPWFWGRDGCFITPWTANFDPVHALVTITLVWVRLLNLPIHFWSIEALNEIGNALGKFVAVDDDCLQKGMATYVHIYIKVDLSEGLLKKITLNWNSKSWVQLLDYENTTFRCRTCLNTWHLQGSCPMAQPLKKRKPKLVERWACPVLEAKTKDVDDETIQTEEKKETSVELNQERKHNTWGQEPMQGVVNTQTISEVEEHSDPA